MILLLAVGLAYSNSLHGAFLYDDYLDILENKFLDHLWPLRDVFATYSGGRWALHTRPVVTLSFAINRAMGGLNSFQYHLTNLVIHLLGCLALFGFARRTFSLPVLKKRYSGEASFLALMIALLWGLHPLQTESVSYVTQRYESLMGLFVLLTFYCLVRMADTRSPQAWGLVTSLSCLLALGSKEVAVSLPILILLYDRAFMASSFRDAFRTRRALYLGLILAWTCFFTIQILAPDRGWAGFALPTPWWRYTLSQPGVILHYLRLSIWPHPLCLDYGWPAAHTWRQILPGALCLGIVALFSLWALVRRPRLGFLFVAFFLILAPTSSVMPINDLAVEHRMYLPLASVVTLAVLGAYHLLTSPRFSQCMRPPLRRVLGISLVAISLASLGALTYLRNEDYQKPLDIWQDTVAKAPKNPRTHHNFAFHLAEAGFFEESIRQYKIAIQQAPYCPLPYMNLGALFGKLKRYDESLDCLRKALALEPDNPKHYTNLGITLLNKGSVDSSIICFNKALELDPKTSETFNGLALAYQQKQQLEISEKYFLQALQADKKIDYIFNYGVLLLIKQQRSQAMAEFETAIRMDPNPVESTSRMGWVLYQHCEYADAVRVLRKALDLKPKHTKSLVRLAWVLATCPDPSFRNGTEALAYAEKVIALVPRRTPELLDLLAVAAAECGDYARACASLQEALAQTPNPNESWAQDLRQRLELFKSGRPYRETPPGGIHSKVNPKVGNTARISEPRPRS